MEPNLVERPKTTESNLDKIPHKPFFGPVSQPESERDNEAWQRVEKEAFATLQNMGIVSVDMTGKIEVDLDNLHKFSIREFKDLCRPEKEGGTSLGQIKKYGGNSRRLFVNLFWDRKVLIKGEEDKGLRTLIYIPEDAQSAFDIDNIRKTDAVVALHEIGTKSNAFWDKPMPTIEDGFNSSVSMQEGLIPYIIYKKGNGRRDEGGNLWVDKIPGKPEEGRQNFSGRWITDSMGVKGSAQARWDSSPRRVIETIGAEWEKRNLLTLEDIPVRNSEKTIYQVTNDRLGYVYIGNKQMVLGSNYGGMQVEKISNHEYSVTDPATGDVRLVFSTQIKPEHIRECTVVETTEDDYRRKTVHVPSYAIDRSDSEEHNATRAYIYQGVSRKPIMVDLSNSALELVKFREALSSEFINHFDELSVKDQIAIYKVVENSSDEDAAKVNEIISKSGSSGAQIIADAFYEGGVSPDLFELAYLNKQNLTELLDSYAQSKESAQNLVDSIRDRLKDKDVLTQEESILLERVSQAFEYKAIEFCEVAARDNVDLVKAHLDDLAELTSVVAGLVGSQTDFVFDYMPDAKQGVNGGRYTLDDGGILTLTVRPEAKDNAQARISLTYRSPEGKKTNIRIDYDEYGLSLDLATRGTDISNTLRELGRTYHTQAPFESAFERDFQAFANKIPDMLNWPSI